MVMILRWYNIWLVWVVFLCTNKLAISASFVAPDKQPLPIAVVKEASVEKKVTPSVVESMQLNPTVSVKAPVVATSNDMEVADKKLVIENKEGNGNIMTPSSENSVKRDVDTQQSVAKKNDTKGIGGIKKTKSASSVAKSSNVDQDISKPKVGVLVDYREYQDDIVDSQDFNEVSHTKNAITLVERAADFFDKHTLSEACNAFTHSKDFVLGELYLSLVDTEGVEFAHGEDVRLLFKNVYDLRDTFGTPVFQEIINKGKSGGGWVTYEWRNSTKLTYTKLVKKDGKEYVLSCGYYPHSKKDAVVSLVTSAAHFFNQIMQEGRGVDDALSPMSYPIGRFTNGDLYLYALDAKGIQVAHGERPGLIGSNAWDYKDSNGKLVNQEIISMLNTTDTGVWVEYVSKRAKKRAYAQKVKDAQGNYYYIACGYYPDTTRADVVNLVKKAYQYMKLQGVSRAAQEFSAKRSDDYRYGDLDIMVFDSHGIVVADGNNQDNIGHNIYNEKDGEGRYYVQDIIKRANNNGSTWTTIKKKNSYFSAYFESVDIGLERYYIGSGLYPVSKKETMVLMVKGGVDYFNANESFAAFNEFTNEKSKFIRGDLSLFVFDNTGTCYAYGDDKNLVWRNLLNVMDDNGKPFIQALINNVKEGATFVTYKLNGANKIVYVESIEKNGKTYVIGSGFYQ